MLKKFLSRFKKPIFVFSYFILGISFVVWVLGFELLQDPNLSNLDYPSNWNVANLDAPEFINAFVDKLKEGNGNV